ncbi:hypothetical protein EIP91_001420 [Steccherinum ochraceum]|uniref:Uncharacterized protein n=1 Tax=Steccherinum ochraceum TaxID=92696 RepID=A0A4R0RE26_9APHY|nr:hypothetical protein EIP91_001420 [Steccherinum ochraceum]
MPSSVFYRLSSLEHAMLTAIGDVVSVSIVGIQEDSPSLSLRVIPDTTALCGSTTRLHHHTVQNGQVLTNGLAIVDSPQPNTVLHAGDYINLAVEMTGNGKLPQSALIPYSNAPNAYSTLEFYLVSAQTKINITLAVGNTLLYVEPSSTVKHVSWALPKCMGAGAYNLTAYETSTIRGVPRFSITPIPVTVQNSSPVGSCADVTNPVLPQPQPANQEPQSPWLDPSFMASLTQVTTPSFPSSTQVITAPSAPSMTQVVTAPSFTMPSVITVTVGPTGVAWPLSMVPTGVATTVYIQPSAPTSMPPPVVVTSSVTSIWQTASTYTNANGGFGVAGSGEMQVFATTVTVTPTPTQVTVVFVSVETLTTTAPGQTVVETTTATSTLSSMTAFVGSDSDSSQFLPVNAAISLRSAFPRFFFVPVFVLPLGLALL